MPRVVPLHLIAIAALVGTTAFILDRIGAALPTANARIIIGIAATLVTAWLALLSLRAFPSRDPDRPAVPWRDYNRLIVWMSNAALVAGFWLAMPYADESLRLMAVMFQFATVIVGVLSTIERPPARARFAFAPLVLPLTTALYFVVHWERYSLAVVLFLLAYAYVTRALGQVLQRSVDRAYADRQAAQAALAEVAAERDAKTRFLASASHDLGQPLQAARLFFDQAMRSRTLAQRQAAARKVTWAFDATEQLLRQMLDHLRLEAGAIEPHIADVAVGPLIARIAELNEPTARLAGVTLLALPSRLQAAADVALAERALGNLVANSIRHAKARRVLVGARRQAGRVRLWVVDDGVGISEADAPRLFDDYVQGSNHGDEIRGGFGLGLGSARRMAGLMGGSVGLDRKWRHGSAFWLELDAADVLARG
jgi:signal transduction histidine kinase